MLQTYCWNVMRVNQMLPAANIISQIAWWCDANHNVRLQAQGSAIRGCDGNFVAGSVSIRVASILKLLKLSVMNFNTFNSDGLDELAEHCWTCQLNWLNLAELDELDNARRNPKCMLLNACSHSHRPNVFDSPEAWSIALRLLKFLQAGLGCWNFPKTLKWQLV